MLLALKIKAVIAAAALAAGPVAVLVNEQGRTARGYRSAGTGRAGPRHIALLGAG